MPQRQNGARPAPASCVVRATGNNEVLRTCQNLDQCLAPAIPCFNSEFQVFAHDGLPFAAIMFLFCFNFNTISPQTVVLTGNPLKTWRDLVRDLSPFNAPLANFRDFFDHQSPRAQREIEGYALISEEALKSSDNESANGWIKPHFQSQFGSGEAASRAVGIVLACRVLRESWRSAVEILMTSFAPVSKWTIAKP